MFIYTEVKSRNKVLPQNDRVIDWHRKFLENFGWRSDDMEIQQLNLRRHAESHLGKSFEESDILGDVVVIMRFGKRDADQFVQYCAKRYADSQPERDRLRELERTRKERCRENHLKFRNHVKFTSKNFQRYILFSLICFFKRFLIFPSYSWVLWKSFAPLGTRRSQRRA